MRILLYISLFLNIQIPENIFLINSLKEEAVRCYLNKDHVKALDCYKRLIINHKNQEGSVLLNYANACMLTKDTLSALQGYYMTMKYAQNHQVISKAYSQAGLMEYVFNKNRTQAIFLLKKALIIDTDNEYARNNLLKILIITLDDLTKNSKKYKETNLIKSNDDIQENNNHDNNIGTEETINEEPQAPNKISLTQARQILDAMQKTELQFIQQLKYSNQDSVDKKTRQNLW